MSLVSQIAFPSPSTLLFAVLVLLALCGAIILLAFVRHRIKQLPLRKIPAPPSTSWLTGNRDQIFSPFALKFHEHLFKMYGNVVRITGLLGESTLVISDASACSSILTKEQDNFEETPWFLEANRHTFGDCLLATTGAHHRKQRKLLNPVFSIKHMRTMVPLFQDVTRVLGNIIRAKTASGPQEIEIVDWLGRLALELIAQGGLGYTFNSLKLDSEETEYMRAIREFSPARSKLVVWRPFFPLVSKVIPPVLLRIGAACLPFPNLHRVIKITDVMHANAKAVYEEKTALLEKGNNAFADQVGAGKDIITSLLQANLDATEEDRLPDEEIIAQMSTFVFAATDTSTALSRTFNLLSQHPDVQDKLREELKDAQADAGESGLGYDALVGLPYLEAVCRETLRLYPPVIFVQRLCRADTSIPLSHPVQTSDGAVSSLYVPRNTTVFVNILAINRDPNIWGPDAAEWKPERWLAPLPPSVAEAHIPGVYSNTLTFIGGGRACIGFKFSQLEMKVALAELIPCFRFSPAKQEIVWRFGGVVTPSVKGSTSGVPQMPIVVERV